MAHIEQRVEALERKVEEQQKLIEKLLSIVENKDSSNGSSNTNNSNSSSTTTASEQMEICELIIKFETLQSNSLYGTFILSKDNLRKSCGFIANLNDTKGCYPDFPSINFHCVAFEPMKLICDDKQEIIVEIERNDITVKYRNKAYNAQFKPNRVAMQTYVTLTVQVTKTNYNKTFELA
eukprot:TRINITY_DN1317_c0_g1_i1.p1 TRINITY_DN1317_c0_g1~~TRINITY_DN1317_c0_g1_i1.p1  ORF type:complete len:179 (-),score=68.60 TRINITY_DN1317_c0_g1_i1:144-680(-)